MKRALVIAHQFPNVSETFIVDHVEGLRRDGWEPIVVCGQVHRDHQHALTAERGTAIRTEVISSPHPKTAAFVVQVVASFARAIAYSPRTVGALPSMLLKAALLEHLFRRFRPDLVHAHFADNGMCAALASRGRIPVLVDFHGHDFTVLPTQLGWDVMRHVLRDCALVAHSAFAADRIEKGLGRPVTRVQLGVDLALFRAMPRADEWPHSLRWLIVGRLEEKKGQDVAIRALALARGDPQQRSPELILVGDGSRRTALHTLAESLGVAAHVRFKGALSHGEVAAQMAEADVLLVPSIPTPDGSMEAFGRVAIEGLACGLPVIVSDIGGLPEAVAEAGWKVAAGDPGALASSIAAVIAGGTPDDYRARSLARAEVLTNERMWSEYRAISNAASSRLSRGAAGGRPPSGG